jgi:adenylate cyclase class 2
MYEVEVKFRADHDALRPEVAARGRHVGTVTQRDSYYDAPHRSFAETDEALRVREETEETEATGDAAPDGDGPVTRLTYKGPLVDEVSKSRREHETAVADGGAMASALEALGFQPAAVVEKRRERYAVEGLTVVLDEVTDVGQFLEIETESAELEAAREEVFDLARELGFDPESGIRESYLGMVLATDNGGNVRE